MSQRARKILFLLFFVSGFSSLVYQVVWTRLAFASFGVITPVLSVVLTSFQKLNASSFRAIYAALENRLARLQNKLADLPEEEEEGAGGTDLGFRGGDEVPAAAAVVDRLVDLAVGLARADPLQVQHRLQKDGMSKGSGHVVQP